MNVMPEPRAADPLNPCEYLLVWAWRLVVTRRGHCPLLGKLFRDACGDGADEVSGALCTFLCALACTRRRRLEVNPPGCLALSSDEKRMLGLLAAAQRERRALLDAHLCWIARPAQRHTLERGARELAAVLSARQLRLPVPVCPVPAAWHGRVAAPPSATWMTHVESPG